MSGVRITPFTDPCSGSQSEFLKRFLYLLQMLEDRTKLPVAHSYDEIIQAIDNNTVTVIRGETGSGKTTQVTSWIKLY